MKSLLTILKGIAMGAADIVPGVSGGTIAFITGIYEELIESIKSLNLHALTILFKEGPTAFWKSINGAFLLRLFTGILFSILILSKFISYLLNYHPVKLWSFFFGLIIASVFLIIREIGSWKKRVYFGILIGTIVSYFVTIATPTQSPDGLIYLFFYGFFAIIAMILPGISGAFILLLLGAYSTLIGIVNNFRIALTTMDMEILADSGLRIFIFLFGCLSGLIAFSRVLSWMFKNYKNTTLAMLTGFMIGSLNKIWPWKETISSRIAHEGKINEAIVPFIQDNVWPWNFEGLNQVEKSLSILPEKDPQMMISILIMVFGAGLIFLLSRFAPKND